MRLESGFREGQLRLRPQTKSCTSCLESIQTDISKWCLVSDLAFLPLHSSRKAPGHTGAEAHRKSGVSSYPAPQTRTTRLSQR